MTERDDAMPKPGPDDDRDLAPFLRAARDDVAEAGEDFLARILSDAHMVQDEIRDGAGIAAAKPGRLSIWAALKDALGGWGPASALAASVVLGFWVGYGDPTGLTSQVGLFATTQSSETVDIFTALDDFAVEG